MCLISILTPKQWVRYLYNVKAILIHVRTVLPKGKAVLFFEKHLLHRNKLFDFTSGHKLIFVAE